LVLVPLLVAFVAQGAAVRLNHEHSEYRWFSAEEARQILPFFSQRANIEHVRTEFVERQPYPLARILPKSS
jgi:dATP pyrophosphohydrolase